MKETIIQLFPKIFICNILEYAQLNFDYCICSKISSSKAHTNDFSAENNGGHGPCWPDQQFKTIRLHWISGLFCYPVSGRISGCKYRISGRSDTGYAVGRIPVIRPDFNINFKKNAHGQNAKKYRYASEYYFIVGTNY